MMKKLILFLLFCLIGCVEKTPKNITEVVHIAIENEAKNGVFSPKDLQNIATLIKNGANPEIREEGEHFSPLIYILHHPKSEMLKVLLDSGFDPNYKFVYQELDGLEVPMIFETTNDVSHENFKLLINRGVSVNTKIERENKILILETALLSPKNTLFLLEKGADFQVENNNGMSVAYLVQKNLDARKMLIAEADLRKIYPNITPEQIQENILAEKQQLEDWQKVRDFLVKKGVRFPVEIPEKVKRNNRARNRKISKTKRYNIDY